MKRDSVVFNTANAQGVTVDALLSQLQNACPNKEFRIRAERAMMEVERRSVIEAVTSAFETLGLEAKVSKHELKEIIFLISDPQEEEALVLSAAVG